MWWTGVGLGLLAVVLGIAFTLYSRTLPKQPPYENPSASSPYNRRSTLLRYGLAAAGIGALIVFVSLVRVFSS